MSEPSVPPSPVAGRALSWIIELKTDARDGWRRAEVAWSLGGDDALIASVDGQSLAECVAGAAAALSAFAARIGPEQDLLRAHHPSA